MEINLNDCKVIGESNKIFDIMLAYNMYIDEQIESNCCNEISKQICSLYKTFASYMKEYPESFITLSFMKDIVKSRDCLEKIVYYKNEHYYLYDRTLDCNGIYVRDIKIVSNVLILICE